MAKVKIDAEDSTIADVRKLLGLHDKDPLTLETVIEHAALGHPVDVEYVSDLLKTPLTLAYVRAWMSRMVVEQAELVNQSQRLTAQAGHLSDDDLIRRVLAHCPPEVLQGMHIAQEQHPQLSLIQIVASVLIANRDALHAGDTSLLNPPEQVARGAGASGAGPYGIERAPVTCGVAECSRPFLPKPNRSGQKYGCQACGEYAAKTVIWAQQKTRAEAAQQRFIVPAPTFAPAECTCGQEAKSHAM